MSARLRDTLKGHEQPQQDGIAYVLIYNTLFRMLILSMCKVCETNKRATSRTRGWKQQAPEYNTILVGMLVTTFSILSQAFLASAWMLLFTVFRLRTGINQSS